MRTLRTRTALLLFCAVFITKSAIAQGPNPVLDIQAYTGANYYESNGLFIVTNGVQVTYTDTVGLTVLNADNASINQNTGDIEAQGAVRIQKGGETWTGDHIHYNFKTKHLDAEKFRLGQGTVFLEGQALKGVGEGTNGLYHGTNGMVTTDDYYKPLQKVRARRFTIVPNKYVEAHDATLYIGSVPVFYLPYYRRSLEHDQNEFTFVPGYRNKFGPYLLSSYNWVYNDELRGSLHADYREKRGVGVGPDVKYNFGDFGEGIARFYFTHDDQPGLDPFIGTQLPHDRQRTYFAYNATPLTNLTISSQVAYQSDPYVVRDFFESEYNHDIQPNTFVNAEKFWQNWSLDAIAQPRVNPFWETVERLPEVRLEGYRQQIGDTPLYYESESSVGYYQRLFANTNNPLTDPLFFPKGDFYGSRADTFHQVTLPQTYFGWLNFTPRAGGRFTYYENDSGPGGTNASHHREVFETGAEVSMTASRTWPGVESKLLDVDGIRHIFQPSIDYVYIPQPNVLPGQLPQYDYQLTNNLRLLPLEMPNYNSIDSINRENTIRYGINNRIQTKRNGEVDDLVNWGVYTDWHLRPRTDQTTFSDIYSDLSLKPRSWLILSSFTRYSIENSQFNLAQHNITIQPNTTWNWSLGHLFLRSGPTFGNGDNLYTSVFFYRFNENWGTRIAHYFDANHNVLQEQDYSIYRDLRSWTAALTFRYLNNLGNGHDYSIAFTFSLKSFPRFGLGQDTVRAAPLLGY